MDKKLKILVFVALLALAFFSGAFIFPGKFSDIMTSTTTTTSSTTTTTETTSTTTSTTTTTTSKTTTTSTTITTAPCGGNSMQPCNTSKGLSCNRGYTINSKWLCAPVTCSRSVRSGMDGCCARALYWCMGD